MRRPTGSAILAACIVALAAVAGCTSGPAEPISSASSPSTSVPSASSDPSGSGGAAAVATAPPTRSGPGAGLVPAASRWWDDRTFYEIFVRSFQDSDGDGIGDLRGVIDRLDYLNDGDPSTDGDLGVTGIWLMPIFPSPSSHGYDTTDYRSVNPEYGTLEDLRELLAKAHERGIAVILDLALNHTSYLDPWFVASRRGSPDKADWYVWIDGTSDARGPSGQQVWWDDGARSYFGLFGRYMPDLNLRNPQVTAELEDVARLWVGLGVDGFRLDAAQHLIEQGGTYAGTPATRQWLAGFNQAVKAVRPDALLVGEVWADSATSSSYVPTQVDLTFDFTSAQAAASTAVLGDASALLSSAHDNLARYPAWQVAVFTDNHDLPRLATLAFDDPDRLRLIATWLLTSPGVPFLFYGQEIGLPGQKPDERIRSPLPWSGDAPAAGFTTGTPWEPLQGGWQGLNVANQQADRGSLLHHYQSLIRLRSREPALRTGSVRALAVDEPGGFAYLRTLGDDQVLVVGNASGKPISDLTVRLPATSRGTWTTLLGQPVTGRGSARFTPIATLGAWETAVLRRSGPEGR